MLKDKNFRVKVSLWNLEKTKFNNKVWPEWESDIITAKSTGQAIDIAINTGKIPREFYTADNLQITCYELK